MNLIELFLAVVSLFLPSLLTLLAVVALCMPDREENDDDTGSKNDNDSNT